MEKLIKIVLIGSIFVALLAGTLFAKNKEEEIKPYKLINSDQLFLSKSGDEYITQLTGNVHFFYGEIEFFCDQAEIYEKQKIARMSGNVKAIDDTLELKANQADYFRFTEYLLLVGNVHIKETHKDRTIRTFASDKGEYFKKEGNIFANDNIKVYDQREKVHGTCGYLTYNLKNGYGYLIKEPVIYMTGADSLKIIAQKMELFKNLKKIVATFDVKTFTKDITTTSDFLIYLNDEEKAIYMGKPKFTSDFAEGKAETITLWFSKKSLNKIVLNDSCYVTYASEKNLPKINWIESDSMRMEYVKDNPKYFFAMNNVKSYYFQDNSAKKDKMNNLASGQNLLIEFTDDKKIKYLTLKNQAKGKYKFRNK